MRPPPPLSQPTPRAPTRARRSGHRSIEFTAGRSNRLGLHGCGPRGRSIRRAGQCGAGGFEPQSTHDSSAGHGPGTNQVHQTRVGRPPLGSIEWRRPRPHNDQAQASPKATPPKWARLHSINRTPPHLLTSTRLRLTYLYQRTHKISTHRRLRTRRGRRGERDGHVAGQWRPEIGTRSPRRGGAVRVRVLRSDAGGRAAGERKEHKSRSIEWDRIRR